MGRHEAKTTPIEAAAPTDPIPKAPPAAPTVSVASSRPVEQRPVAQRPAPRAVGRRAPPPASRQTKDRLRWALAATFAVIVVAVGVVLGLNLGGESEELAASAAATPSPSPTAAGEQPPPPAPVPVPPTANGLSESFAAFAAEQLGPSVVGLVAAPVGGEAITVDQWEGAETAWSTIKVPLAIAGLNSDGGAALMPDVTAALTVSDNAAAERIWAALGSGQTAADAVEAVLQAAGDPTRVQPNRIRPEFTPFGQTNWPLAEQVKFLSHAACDQSAATVLELMGQVSSDRWGLGQLDGSQFKGGWGPSEAGGYLVRQFGILTDASGGKTVVAMAVEPSGGSFGEGQTDMNTIAQWLTDHRAELPTGACAAQP